MCHGITDPTTTPLKTSTGQILNFGGHDGSECHLVPLPIRLNRKRFREQTPATAMEEVDYATLRSAFDRINSENNCLRREVSSLNGALSELFSVVGRLREDLDVITADHDRLAEQVGWQHVGMVRLGGFNPYQSLSIQQRQQVFARERRNMMAYRSMGPDRFMSTVLHQDRLLGLQSDFNVVGGVGARLDYPREEATADTQLLIEFNDVGDGSSLPQAVLWAIARNKLQRVVQLPGDGRFYQSSPFSAGTPILHRCFPSR